MQESVKKILDIIEPLKEPFFQRLDILTKFVETHKTPVYSSALAVATGVSFVALSIYRHRKSSERAEEDSSFEEDTENNQTLTERDSLQWRDSTHSKLQKLPEQVKQEMTAIDTNSPNSSNNNNQSQASTNSSIHNRFAGKQTSNTTTELDALINSPDQEDRFFFETYKHLATHEDYDD